MKHFQCRLGNAEVTVSVECTHGSAGSYETPPEGPEIDIVAVLYEGRDIISLIDRNKNTKVFDTLMIDVADQLEDAYDED